MKVNQTTLTIAEYCKQIELKDIYPNNDYQRSSKVWPPAARSYLIDTILEGYPMPKVSLYQKTDLRTRKTVKEIVDGQQRTQAINDFYNDRLKISGKGNFSGKKYSTLPEEVQQQFLDYALPVDLFVGATEPEIRQVFRRMNSYTVPLNENERRHAIFQGEFKWFIVDLTVSYSQVLKDIEIFPEKQISRMADSQFFSEICYALINGLETFSKTRLEDLYKKYDNEDTFTPYLWIKDVIDFAIVQLLSWPSLHKTSMLKPSVAYSLILSIAHFNRSCNVKLDELFPLVRPASIAPDAESRLGALVDAFEADSVPVEELAIFVKASGAGTNTKINREIRFKSICKIIKG